MSRALLVCGVAVAVAASAVAGAGSQAVPGPAATLEALVAAAAAGDQAAERQLVSGSPTQEQLAALAALVAPLAPGSRVIVDEELEDGWGIAAVQAGPRSLALPLTKASGAWLVVIPGPMRMNRVLPLRTTHVKPLGQIAVGIASSADVDQAGVWLDGFAFSGQSGGTDGGHLTIWGRPGRPLRAGRHSVVAFASAGQYAAAIAWTFTVGRR